MKPIGKVRYITLHVSATRPSMDIGVREIRDWHVNGNGWSDIGYHGVIRRDGTPEPGRSMSYQGAHVGGHNAGNIGICLVGGVRESDGTTPENNITDAQWITLFNRVKALMAMYPDAVIMGHNGFPGHEARGCPCFDWKAWRTEFHKRTRQAQIPFPSHWFDEIDAEPEGNGRDSGRNRANPAKGAETKR